MKSTLLQLGVFVGSIAMACGNAYETRDNSGTTDGLPAVAQQPTASIDEQASVATTQPTGEAIEFVAIPNTEPAVSYLVATVEACSPVADTDADPCDPDRYLNYRGYVEYSEPGQLISWLKGVMHFRPYPPDTTQEVVRRRLENALIEEERFGNYYLPHVVVRGVFLPGTSRCAVNEEVLRLADEGMKLHSWPDPEGGIGYVSCFIDFQARDYLFGKGPQYLTVSTPSKLFYTVEEHQRYKTERYQTALAAAHDELWEGNEAILWLGIHRWSAKVEVWGAIWITNVQRDQNGQVVVATPGPAYHSSQGPNEPYVDRIYPPLDDFRHDLRAAFEEIVEELELKPIGDANQKHLRALYASHGAHDIKDVETDLPPAVLE